MGAVLRFTRRDWRITARRFAPIGFTGVTLAPPRVRASDSRKAAPGIRSPGIGCISRIIRDGRALVFSEG